jgi:hypothetical protein
MNLDNVFQTEDKEEIEQALYDDESGSVVHVDWREEEESIVQYFADASGEDLTSELTDKNDLVIRYDGQKVKVGLRSDMGDRYRTLRAVRDILAGKYEIRIIRSSLDSDTHSFAIRDKEWWRQLDARYGALSQEVFAPFTNDVEFR